MSTTWTKINYGGWANCYRLATDTFELIVTTDVGPRIIKYAPVGGQNLFKEYTEQLGLTGGTEWRIYGGHRLWHAPEDPIRTYAPDNEPVEVILSGDTLCLSSSVETRTGIRKELTISPTPDGRKTIVVHRIINCGAWPVTLAPWCLTAMRETGTALIPLPKKRPHSSEALAANWSLSCWPYTDFSDPRYEWGEMFLKIKQDPTAVAAQKVGLFTGSKWAAYIVDDVLFLKSIETTSSPTESTFPDRGAQWEIFTDRTMLELESLGPEVIVAPGEHCAQTECWRTFAHWGCSESEPLVYNKIRALL